MSLDISGIIKSTGIALETEAAKQFGAAIEGVGGGLLKDIFKIPGPNTSSNQVKGENRAWTSTQYAAGLVKADQVQFNPKLKFLFKISFEFDQALISAASQLGYDMSSIQQNVSFMVRHVDRPKFDYDYEEVNMYNFRTKVLKSIKHREVAFTLYDDVGNNVLNFINMYRKLQAPIARREQLPTSMLEDFGFEFDKTLTGADTAMRGSLPGDCLNILTKMTVHQIFVERGAVVTNPGDLVKSVDFVFINPRFTNIDIDDMDHENGGNFNLISVTADFDTMFQSEPKNYSQDTAPSLSTGDITAAGGGGAKSQMGSSRNPFLAIIANQSGRAVQSSVSNILNKTLSNIPGGGLIAGQLSSISSTIGDAAKRTISGLGSGIAISANSLLRDNSTPSAQISSLSSQDYNQRGDF